MIRLDHGKQLAESTELIKKDFNIDRYSIPHEVPKNIVEERCDFQNFLKNNPMMYMDKTEGRSPKDIINYGKLKNLFTNSRDSNINPKEVLKYQINFKSYLSEIKK